MKIAFDVHGVLDEYPDDFKRMINLLQKMNHSICVVSGPSSDKIREELKALGYGIHTVYSVVNFLQDDGVEFRYDDDGNPWCDEQKWWDAKARICRDREIDFLIDDSLKYKPAFDLIDSEFIHVSEVIGE